MTAKIWVDFVSRLAISAKSREWGTRWKASDTSKMSMRVDRWESAFWVIRFQGVKLTDEARLATQDAVIGRIDKIVSSKEVYQLFFTDPFHKPA